MKQSLTCVHAVYMTTVHLFIMMMRCMLGSMTEIACLSGNIHQHHPQIMGTSPALICVLIIQTPACKKRKISKVDQNGEITNDDGEMETDLHNLDEARHEGIGKLNFWKKRKRKRRMAMLMMMMKAMIAC